MTVGTITVIVGVTTVGKFGIGLVEGALEFKVLLDAGVYVGALVVCGVQ